MTDNHEYPAAIKDRPVPEILAALVLYDNMASTPSLITLLHSHLMSEMRQANVCAKLGPSKSARRLGLEQGSREARLMFVIDEFVKSLKAK